MDEFSRAVFEETQRLNKLIPSLLERLANRWVVFKDGEVKADFATPEAAYAEAAARYPNDPVVVARVAEVHAIPLTAAVLFG